MKITLDQNSDKIYINPDERYKNIEVEYNRSDMRDPINFIKSFLQEIFNRLDDSRLSSSAHHFDIQLEEINEDRTSSIGEW